MPLAAVIQVESIEPDVPTIAPRYASDTAIMFGLWEQFSLPAGIATLPVALWEFSLGAYLVIKGFKPSPITAGMTASSTGPGYQDAA